MAQRDARSQASLTRDMGARLREAREERGVTLRRLAQLVEVSPSLLSQIENGLARPSVGTLWALVDELGVSGGRIFDGSPAAPDPADGSRRVGPPGQHGTTDPAGHPGDPDDPGRPGPPDAPDLLSVQRAADRAVIELSGSVRWEQLDASHDPGVVFAFVTYEPGGEAGGHPAARHAGHEYGFMVSGRLAIELGGRTVEIGPGDSVSFDSRHPHRFSAVGDEAARAVWFNVAP